MFVHPLRCAGILGIVWAAFTGVYSGDQLLGPELAKAPRVEGVFTRIEEGKGYIRIEKGNTALPLFLPLPAEKYSVLRLRMKMRAAGVTPGAEGWRNGRLAMCFLDAGNRPVGGWPEVFSASGTGDWIECERDYEIPAGAVKLRLEPANFGSAGQMEFADVQLEGLTRAEAGSLPVPGGGSLAALMTLDDAWRQTTSTRERISLNGLWQFRPVLDDKELRVPPKPEDGWGFFKIPGSWPVEKNGMKLYLPASTLSKLKLPELNSAWYRREVVIPGAWANRRILLSADLIQSCAVILVDGVKAGQLDYPGGEVDLTGFLIPGRRHVLTLLVSARPEVQSDFMAPDRIIERSAMLQNRGVTGDLYLDSIPDRAAVGDVHVITSVRDKSIRFDTGFRKLPAGRYRLEAAVSDRKGNPAYSLASEPFDSDGRPEQRHVFSGRWENPELWDTDAPENLYVARVRLRDAAGNLLDEFLPQEFGFREFRIEGRDFYLNDKKIHLRAFVTRAPQEADFASAARIDHLVKCSRDFGVNFLIGWNYSFSPGVFAYPAGFHELTSRQGMLTSLTLPHIKDFANDLAGAKNAAAYRRQSEHLIRRFQNVPGVVMYVMNHNALGYMGDQNPLRIGNGYLPDAYASLPLRAQGKTAEKIARTLDPSRPIYHHESGNLGDVCTLNCYLNWSPRQERSDWLEPWEKSGTLPVFFVEWGLPHVASWSSYRGPAFIWNSKVVQCLWINEYNAAILGEEAYRNEPAKQDLYELQARSVVGNRSVFFNDLGANGMLSWIEDVRRVRAYFAERNFPDLRARGISGILPWDQFQLWSWRGAGRGDSTNPRALQDLKKPGIVPDLLESRGEAINNDIADFRLNSSGEAVRAGFQEFLCRIAGRIGDFSENGHNFQPGEPVRKSLLVLNDSRREGVIRWSWQVPELKIGGQGECRTPPGGRTDIPVEFTVPENAAGKIRIQAKFTLPDGKTRDDSFAIAVVPRPAPQIVSTVGLYDPENTAAPLLEKLGVRFRTVKAERDLEGVQLLVIGRNGLLRHFPFPLSARLEHGLKLLVLEQDAAVFRRIGLRGQEMCLREVFEADGSKRSDWRGSSTMLPAYGEEDNFETTNPLHNWNFFENTRVWRAGNRGSLIDVIVETPQVGDWLPLGRCGFDLQYSPLLEFREKDGVVLFCQYAVSGRSENEPEAQAILAEALQRLDRYRPADRRPVFYSGGAAGKALLDALNIPSRGFSAGMTIPSSALLVVGPDSDAPDQTKNIEQGLHVLALGLSKEELSRVLPGLPKTASGEYFSDYANGLASVPEFAGICNAELHWRGKAGFDAFPADNPGGRMLAAGRLGRGVFAAVQLPPWKFPEDDFFFRTTRRRGTGLAARMLANLGAEFRSGFFLRLDGMSGRREFALPNRNWLGVADPRAVGREKKWFSPDFKPGKDWRSVRVPGFFDEQFRDLKTYDGWFWYRLEFTLPADLAGVLDEIWLGPVDDESDLWINGTQIASVTKKSNPADYWYFPRNHRIPAGVLKPGRNVIAVLCIDLFNRGGILGAPMLKGGAMPVFYTDKAIASDDPYRYFRW